MNCVKHKTNHYFTLTSYILALLVHHGVAEQSTGQGK